MSKIICDLCGSAFPEDADRCPVCGTAKTEAPVQQEEAPAARRRRPQKKSFGQKIKDGFLFVVDSARQNLGLAIAVLLLILAIIAVCIFIAASLEAEKPSNNNNSSGGTSTSTSTSTPAPTVSCTAITLPSEQVNILLDAQSKVFRLTPAVMPANTTDKITYESSNPAVATVDANGLVTAIADGQAVITVTCGSFSTQCAVVCQLTPPEEPLKLNREDIMLDGYGDNWNLAGLGYTGPDPKEVTWSSADPTIVSVENGKVVALANSAEGVVITAEYKDQKVTCLVRCKNVVVTKYEWSHPGYNNTPDVTVASGWTYNLYLRNKETKEKVEATLTIDKEEYLIITEDGKIKALENTSGRTQVVTVTAEYEGETYTFKIRIKPVETDET